MATTAKSVCLLALVLVAAVSQVEAITTAEKIQARQFKWYTTKTAWSGAIFTSPDVCQNGNGGIRAVSFAQCMTICLSIPACKVVGFFPVWFGGPSACFSLDSTMVAKLGGTTSSVPIVTTDQGSYWGQLY